MAEQVFATGFSGAYTSAEQADRQIRQVDENLVRVYPRRTPFMAMTNHTMGGAAVTNNKLEWNQDAEPQRFVEVAAEVSASGTTFTCDDTSILQTYRLLYDPHSYEVIEVATVTNATTFTTLARGQFSSTPRIIPAGTKLLVGQLSVLENGEMLDPTGSKTIPQYNWVEEFEEVWGYSTRSQMIAHYGPQPKDREQMTAVWRYNRAKEIACMFGVRGQSGSRFRMGGLIPQLFAAGQVFDANGAFTYDEYGDFLMEILNGDDQDTVMALASRRVHKIVSGWPKEYQRADYRVSGKFGLRVKEIDQTGVITKLVHQPLFEGQDDMNGWMLVFNPKRIGRRAGYGMSDTVNMDVKSPKNTGKHGKVSQMTGGMTLKIDNINDHMLIINIRS